MNSPFALEHRARVQAFRRKHRIGLLTMLFTDMVGSTQLTGIRIGQKCRRLHFLHATGWNVPDKTQIGSYLAHYGLCLPDDGLGTLLNCSHGGTLNTKIKR